MGSKEKRRAALYQKIKELEAAKYIEELKEKVEKLQDDITSSSQDISLPVKATVETIDKGFRITVISEEDCPGLLVAILETFEELGLDVRDTNMSCSNKFHLEAIGELQNETDADEIDTQVVKSAVLKAIKNWSDSNDED
ncbi:hypothetical protein L1987_83100 [Smallanthus sonchifolius]|uniref:Uncharacterized protein n=1 Tax=Smallanthus sonchifolius TaxID=185202 RepID=A0ACB8YBP3_9ASTR|nr:hypothetical protein L1987_83100 [Smallanthus sonchifolius]